MRGAVWPIGATLASHPSFIPEGAAMKRAAALLISLLAAAAVLTGCSLLPGRTVTLAEFLSGEEFDALDASITSGADMPD